MKKSELRNIICEEIKNQLLNEYTTKAVGLYKSILNPKITSDGTKIISKYFSNSLKTQKEAKRRLVDYINKKTNDGDIWGHVYVSYYDIGLPDKKLSLGATQYYHRNEDPSLIVFNASLTTDEYMNSHGSRGERVIIANSILVDGDTFRSDSKKLSSKQIRK